MAQNERTRHTCCPPGQGPGFIRTAGCPRCDELTAGAAPRTWGGQTYTKCSGCGRPVERGYFGDRCQACQVRDHFNGERHRSGGCGPVCTFGEW